ncbi:MAG: peptide chain release factor N(5)-glutamine methyltransferase [Oscillospiraceae bacterium]|nr:peptide chain release factor N(5)-glutamine methyltransferase [Oscillospiraceae bacterium]MDY2846709.1 peptide chain release factor N(5)-glutamine methyltransferase [Oscillospiraceae bacterium]
MVIRELIAEIKEILQSAGIEDYDFDGNCIAEDFLGLSGTQLLLNADEEADETSAKKAVKAAEKRASGYPLQYILGKWEFYGLPFEVGEGVLIPRPDTEILVDTVIEYYRSPRKNMRIIDICSGSGCIAVALKKNIPEAEVTAVENSSEAMPYLVRNARLNDAVLRYIKGDVMNGALLDNFADPENVGEFIKFGCIVSNPPYLTAEEMSELQTEVGYEPKYALDGGLDGLKFYRVIACLWKEVLEDNGLLAFEAGYHQCGQVAEIMRKSGFYDVSVRKDLGGNERVIFGFKSPEKEDLA